MVIKVDRENTVWGARQKGRRYGAAASTAVRLPGRRAQSLATPPLLAYRPSRRGRLFARAMAMVLSVASFSALLGFPALGFPALAGPAGATGISSATPRQGLTIPLRVYLMRGDKLGVSGRDVPITKAVARAAVTQLLTGPTKADKRAGLSTDIPPGTHLLAVSIAKGTARVNLSPMFARGADPRTIKARAAQLVYTLTQFPDVSGVLLRVDGRPPKVAGDLLDAAKPLRRSNFEQVTPAILVESPTPGENVTSPLHISGSANVFEAVFRVELRAEAGSLLASARVQATSGTGTRGGFGVTVPFTEADGRGFLVAFEVSPKDGSRQNVVRLPVVFGRS
jgi:germination protein M